MTSVPPHPEDASSPTTMGTGRLMPFDDADEDLSALLVARAPRRRSRVTTALVLVLVFLLGVLVGVTIGRAVAMLPAAQPAAQPAAHPDVTTVRPERA